MDQRPFRFPLFRLSLGDFDSDSFRSVVRKNSSISEAVDMVLPAEVVGVKKTAPD